MDKGFLPSLDETNFGSYLEPTKGKAPISQEKAAYDQFILDQKNRTGVSKAAQAPVLTLKMLEKAPEDFFDRFNPIVAKTTSAIINAISADERSVRISALKKEPNNPELKEAALYVVMSEFERIDRANDEVRLLQPIDKDILLAMVINEIVGLGPLEPIWNEQRTTEIICNGPYSIEIEIGGKLRSLPAVKFRDKKHLSDLIDKLYGSINKSLSPMNPRERGRLHDNSRLYGVHTVIAPDGPNFNIRKHPERYWTPLDIVHQKTASVELMTYLGNLIHAGFSFLVVGGTGTGKTSLTNALTGFFDESKRLITMEENLELKPHPMKRKAAAMECIPAPAGSDKEFGVNLRDLLRSALQMRPDILIIGEVSDGAAYDLCQALNTGHPGGSTLHSNSAQDAMSRLASLVSQEEFVKGNAIFDLIATAFDIVIVVDRLDDGSRKITELVEVGRKPVLSENNELVLETKPLWEFRAEPNESGEIDYSWVQVGDISEYRKKKNRFELKKPMTWNELLEISTYNIPDELRGGVL